MRYMLMMHAPKGEGDWQINNWTPEDFTAHMAFMHQYNKELTEAGEWVDGQGLAMPAEAKVVRAGKDGAPITDGPFAESKEFLAGYWIVEVDSPERAYQLAAKASAAPGHGGAPLNMPIEVRQVMKGPLTDA
ncbi:MAG: YciI family protein [bacterium]